MAEPAVTDIPIVLPAPRVPSQVATSVHLAQLSAQMKVALLMDRQHRDVLLSLRGLGAIGADLATVAVLGSTISNPPTDVEVQAVANKLDELILAFSLAVTRINLISSRIGALIGAAGSKLIAPQDLEL